MLRSMPELFRIQACKPKASVNETVSAQNKVIVKDTHAPPAIDMRAAWLLITLACARTVGRANPVTTMRAVRNRPKSTAGELDS